MLNKRNDFILASGSPRRIEIMKKHGLSPIVIPAEVEEKLPITGGVKEATMFLALKKAKAVEASPKICNRRDIPDSTCHGCNSSRSIIIAADTIVYKDKIMGKPINEEEAFKMLWSLRNSMHYVVTGVALVEAGAENARVFAEVTKVYLKDYSYDELRTYLKTDEAYDKAGGYAIQGYFSRYIEKIEGNYENVVGLPWERIEKEILLL